MCMTRWGYTKGFGPPTKINGRTRSIAKPLVKVVGVFGEP